MTSASSTPDQQFDEKLEEHIHTLLQIAKIAHDPPQDSATLHEQIGILVNNLGYLSALKDGLEVQLPVDVVNNVDEGNNPDLILKGWVQTLVDKNQTINGQIRSIQSLHDGLQNRIQADYSQLEPNNHIPDGTANHNSEATVKLEVGTS